MELEQLIVRIEADTRPLQSALEGMGQQADRTLTDVARLGDRMATSLTAAAVKGEGLSGVLRSIARDLASVTLRDTVVNPVGDLLGGLIGGLFGRAGGGSVSANTPYMVGERGPELFVPSGSGRIESDPGGGAAPVNVSMNIDARGADAGAADRLRAAAADIQQQTFNAVFAAMERGGKYARISGRR